MIRLIGHVIANCHNGLDQMNGLDLKMHRLYRDYFFGSSLSNDIMAVPVPLGDSKFYGSLLGF